MSRDAHVRPYRNNHEHLEDALRLLDLAIRQRVATLALQNQEAPEAQTSRIAYITPAEVQWLLDQDTAPHGRGAAAAEVRREWARFKAVVDSRVARTLQEGTFLALPQLSRLFGLSPFEEGTILTCLAPELDRKYDRLFAYLQDDVTRKRPSVDLVLELQCDTKAQRWGARAFFSDGGSLLRAGLLRKVEDPQSPSGSSGLAQFLQINPRVCEFLLGSNQIDGRLAGYADLLRPADETESPAAPEASVGVLRLVERYLVSGSERDRKLVIHLYGPYGAGKRELVANVCRRLGCPVLSVDTERLLAEGAAAEELVRAAFREGLLQQAALYFKRAEGLLESAARPLLSGLTTAIIEYGRLVFLSAEGPWMLRESFPGCLFQEVALSIPDVPAREEVWASCLTDRAPDTASWVPHLARQFRLTPGQIRGAIDLAENRRRMDVDMLPLSLPALTAACRQQFNHNLSGMAVKIEPHYSWGDIVLPDDTLTHLHEICDQARNHYKVFGTWGFNRKLSYGRGLSALFVGASGTGKTMAAEVLAHELDLDLYKVDLSGVVSKYIGETEKNLSRIFAEAETSNALLFFDEADALFGKRTEVSDAHDRYANIEISYLLQKMEAYEGIVILATNLRENMDEAFTRRIRFVVEFPFPDEANRRHIWQSHFPSEAPTSPQIDYEFLAREFQVAGGSIRNIVLNAAFLAASASEADSDRGSGQAETIGMPEILHGARREFAKMGKRWNEQPFGRTP
jgi:SpoVK/Ycf46/Vps4 family AAA+-type ATPase